MAIDFTNLISKNAGNGSSASGSSSSSQASSDASSQPAWLQSFQQYASNGNNAFGAMASNANLDYNSNSQMQTTESGGTTLNKDEDDRTAGYSDWLSKGSQKGREANAVEKGLHFAGDIGRGTVGAIGKLLGEDSVATQAASTLAAPMFAGTGVESLASAATGTDYSKIEDGYLPDYEMTGTERAGALVSGLVDTVGLGAGGSGTALAGTAKTLGKAAFGSAEREAKTALGRVLQGTGGKGIVGSVAEEQGWGAGKTFAAKTAADSLEEGGEEFVQSIADEARDDQLDEGTLGRAAQAGAIGAAMGGIMSAGGQGLSRLADGPRKLDRTSDSEDLSTTDAANWGNPLTVQQSRVESAAAARQKKKIMEQGNGNEMSMSATVSPDQTHSLSLDQMMEGDENFKASWEGSTDEVKQQTVDLMFNIPEGVDGVETINNALNLPSAQRTAELNRLLKRDQPVYLVHNYKNPQVTQFSHVYMDHAGFFPGTGYKVHPMAASLSNADVDGDMRQRVIDNTALREGVKSNDTGVFMDPSAFWTDGFQEGTAGGFNWDIADRFSAFGSDAASLAFIRDRLLRNAEGAAFMTEADAQALADAMVGKVSEAESYWPGHPEWSFADTGEGRRNAAIKRVRTNMIAAAEEAGVSPVEATRELNRVIADMYGVSMEDDIVLKAALLANGVTVNREAVERAKELNPTGEGEAPSRKWHGNQDQSAESPLTNPAYAATWLMMSPSDILADQNLRDIAGVKYSEIKNSEAFQFLKKQLSPQSSAMVSLNNELGITAEGREVENAINDRFAKIARVTSLAKLAEDGYHVGFSPRQVTDEKVRILEEGLVFGWNENCDEFNEAIKKVTYQDEQAQLLGNRGNVKRTLPTEDGELPASAAQVLHNVFGDTRIGDLLPGGAFTEKVIEGHYINENSSWNDLWYALQQCEKFPAGMFEGTSGSAMQSLLRAYWSRARGELADHARKVDADLDEMFEFKTEQDVADNFDHYVAFFNWVSEVLGGEIMVGRGMATAQGFLMSVPGRQLIFGDKATRQNAIFKLRLYHQLAPYLVAAEKLKKINEAKDSDSAYDIHVNAAVAEMRNALVNADDGSYLMKVLISSMENPKDPSNPKADRIVRSLLDLDRETTLEDKQQMMDHLLTREGNAHFDVWEWAVEDSVYGRGSTFSDRYARASVYAKQNIAAALQREEQEANELADALDSGLTIDTLSLACMGGDHLMSAEAAVSMAAASTSIVAEQAEKGQVRTEQVTWATDLALKVFGKEYTALTQWQSVSNGDIHIDDLITNRKVLLGMIFKGERYSVHADGHRFNTGSTDTKMGTEEFLRFALGKWDPAWVRDGVITEVGLSALLRAKPAFASMLAPTSLRIDYMTGSNQPMYTQAKRMTALDAVNNMTDVNKQRRLAEQNRVAEIILNQPGWLEMFLHTVDVNPNEVSAAEYYRACMRAWHRFLRDWHVLLSKTGSDYNETRRLIESKMARGNIAQYAKQITDTITDAKRFGTGGHIVASDLFRSSSYGMIAVPEDFNEKMDMLIASLNALRPEIKAKFNAWADHQLRDGSSLFTMLDDLKKSFAADFDNETLAKIDILLQGKDTLLATSDLTRSLVATTGLDAYKQSIEDRDLNDIEEMFNLAIEKDIASKLVASDEFHMAFLDDVLTWCRDNNAQQKMEDLIDDIFANNDSKIYAIYKPQDLKDKWAEIIADPGDPRFERKVATFVAQVNRMPMDMYADSFAAQYGLGANFAAFTDLGNVYEVMDEVKSSYDNSDLGTLLYAPTDVEDHELFTTWNFTNQAISRSIANAKNFPITASIETGIAMNGGAAMSMQGIACLPSNIVCSQEPDTITYEEFSAANHYNCHYRFTEQSGLDTTPRVLSEVDDVKSIFDSAPDHVIEIWPKDQACTCGMCCAHHSSSTNAVRSGMRSELATTVLRICGTTQEAMELKRKKLADFARKVINAPRDLAHGIDMSLQGTTTVEVLAAYNDIVQSLADHFEGIFKMESISNMLTRRDAEVLANSMCVCLTFKGPDGVVRSIGADDFFNPMSDFNNPEAEGTHFTKDGERITAETVLADPNSELTVMPVGLEELNDKIRYAVADHLRNHPEDRNDVKTIQRVAGIAMTSWDDYLRTDEQAADDFSGYLDLMKPWPYQHRNFIVRAGDNGSALDWERSQGTVAEQRERLRRMPGSKSLRYVTDAKRLESLGKNDRNWLKSAASPGSKAFEGVYMAGVIRLKGASSKTQVVKTELEDNLGSVFDQREQLPVLRSEMSGSMQIIDGSSWEVDKWLNDIHNLSKINQVEYVAVPSGIVDDIVLPSGLSGQRTCYVNGEPFRVLRKDDVFEAHNAAIYAYNTQLDVVGAAKATLCMVYADETNAYNLPDSGSIANQAVFDVARMELTDLVDQDISGFMPPSLQRAGSAIFGTADLSNSEYTRMISELTAQLPDKGSVTAKSPASGSRYELILPDPRGGNLTMSGDTMVSKVREFMGNPVGKFDKDTHAITGQVDNNDIIGWIVVDEASDREGTVKLMPLFVNTKKAQHFEIVDWTLEAGRSKVRTRASVVSGEELKTHPRGLASKSIVALGDEEFERKRSHLADDYIEQQIVTEASSFTGKLKGRVPWLRTTNLYFASQAMPTSIRYSLGPDGKWAPNGDLSDQGQEYAELLASEKNGSAEKRMWRGIRDGNIIVFNPECEELNSAMRKIAAAYLRHYPSLTGREIFESHNFTDEGQPSSFRQTMIEEPYNVFGRLSTEEHAAIFHEMNPYLCAGPNEDSDPEKHWVDVTTGKIRNMVNGVDEDGEKATAAFFCSGYIGPMSTWFKRMGLGEPSASASSGLQSDTTSALVGGLNSSNIGNIVDAIEAWNSNPDWYQAKVNKKRDIDMYNSYMPEYDPDVDAEVNSVLESYAVQKHKEYTATTGQGYRKVWWKVRSNGRDVKMDDKRLTNMCQRVKEEFGLSNSPTVEKLLMTVQHQFGWSYNNGNCIREYHLKQVERAVDQMIEAYNRGDGYHFVQGNQVRDGEYTLPVLPDELSRYWWNLAGEGSMFHKHFGSYEKFEDAMDREHDIAYQTYDDIITGDTTSQMKNKNRKKRLALIDASEWLYEGHARLNRQKAPGTVMRELTTQQIIDIRNSILGDLMDLEDAEIADIISAEDKANRQHIVEMKKQANNRNSIFIANAYERSGKHVHANNQSSQRASRFLKWFEGVARTNSVCALGMFPGSLLEGGSRIAMMKAGFKLSGLVGWDQKAVRSSTIANMSTDTQLMTFWQLVQEAALLGDGAELWAGVEGSGDFVEFLEEQIKRNTNADQGGFYGVQARAMNKVMKTVNCEKVFRRRNFEIAIERFAQFCTANNVTSMMHMVPGVDGDEQVTYLEYMLLTSPQDLVQELMSPTHEAHRYWMRAVNAANTTSMSRETVGSIALQEIFRKHSALSFVNTVAFSPFYRFGMNLTEKMLNTVLPVSSINYILVNKLKGDPNWEAAGIERAQIQPSLAYALASDALKMTSFALAGILVGLSGVLQAPDDDDLKSDWREYLVFGFRLRDLAWWAEDLLAPAMIMATFYKSCFDGRPNLALLVNGITDMCYANPFMSVGSAVDMILNPEQVESDWAEESQKWTDREGGSPDFWMQAETMAMYGGMHMLTNMMIPSFLRAAYKSDNVDEYELSWKRVWSNDAYESGAYRNDQALSEQDTVTVGYKEAMRRKFALKNPIMALVFDIADWNGTTSYSRLGFGDKASPVRVQYSDPEMRYYANKYSITEQDDSGNWVYKSEDECFAAAYNVLAILEQYDDMAELRANGFAINSQTQYYTAKVLQETINENKTQFYEWYHSDAAQATVLGEGSYTAGQKLRQEAYQQWQEYQNHLYSIKDKLYSDEISKGVASYWRENTTYSMDDSGNWYATGSNSRDLFGQQLMPFTLGDQSDRTVGYEGQWATESAVNEGQSTGERALVPITNFERLDKDEVNAAVGSSDTSSSKSSSYNSSYGYSRGGYSGGYTSYRSGGGSSGSSYSSKIYSTMPTSRYSNAATINPTRLYGASYSYLRPSFETKGSREAYKREDF